MYAVVAPGLKGIYRDTKDIDEILRMYPYARFQKFAFEEQCYQWISENSTSRQLEEIRDYGTALPSCHVVMDYHIKGDFLYVNYDTKNFGRMRIALPDDDDETELTQAPTFCAVKVPFGVQTKPLHTSLLGIVEGLDIIGDMIDVVVKVPDHSVFYALRSYTGNDPVIRRAQAAVRERQGGTSISLKEGARYYKPQEV